MLRGHPMRASLLVLLLACSPPPPMPPPDSGTPGCGATSTLTPPNLMADPSFECDGGAAWSAQQGTFELAAAGHTGMYSGKGTASATGALQFGLGPVVASTSGKAYCIHLWVKGSATDMRYEVLPGAGGMAYSFPPPVTADWARAPMVTNLKVPAPAGTTLHLRFRILNGQPGQTIFVDDVDLWETDGECTER